jgi:hypothetical protein
MRFRFRPSIKRLPAIRNAAGLPNSGPSYMHTDESRIVGFDAPASNPALDSSGSTRRDWRGLLLIALLIFAIAAAAARQ